MLTAWLLRALVQPMEAVPQEIPYSEFKSQLAAGQIIDVTLDATIQGLMKALPVPAKRCDL